MSHFVKDIENLITEVSINFLDDRIINDNEHSAKYYALTEESETIFDCVNDRTRIIVMKLDNEYWYLSSALGYDRDDVPRMMSLKYFEISKETVASDIAHALLMFKDRGLPYEVIVEFKEELL